MGFLFAYMPKLIYAECAALELGSLGQIWLTRMVLALYAMALYDNNKLNARAREYMQTHLHCHFRENDSPAAICNKKLPRIEFRGVRKGS